MFFYTNGKLAWICIAKNACTTWIKVLSSLGWWREDLYIPKSDLEKLEFFAFLRDPNKRHTAGIIQYLLNNKLISLLHNENYNQLLVSACFDEHTYPITLTVPASIVNRCTWFVLDNPNSNYEKLVGNYLACKGIALPPQLPRLNPSTDYVKQLRTQVDQLKVLYHDQHQKLTKNFIGSDLRLYRNQILIQHLWDL